MQIAVISGSSRSNSQSSKVAKVVSSIITNRNNDSFELCLNQNKLPLWHEDIWNQGLDWNKEWGVISGELKKSSGFVIVTPEWDGMVPHCLKNFFHLCCHGELYHKPAIIVSVSAGLGGNYPIAELRMSSYKNTKICYIPEQIVIRNVERYFNSSEEAESREKKLRDRLFYVVDVLLAYSNAFSHIREKGILNREQYPTGM